MVKDSIKELKKFKISFILLKKKNTVNKNVKLVWNKKIKAAKTFQ